VLPGAVLEINITANEVTHMDNDVTIHYLNCELELKYQEDTGNWKGKVNGRYINFESVAVAEEFLREIADLAS
jgi:hypothetical protein